MTDHNGDAELARACRDAHQAIARMYEDAASALSLGTPKQQPAESADPKRGNGSAAPEPGASQGETGTGDSEE